MPRGTWLRSTRRMAGGRSLREADCLRQALPACYSVNWRASGPTCNGEAGVIETALRAHYAKPGVRWMQEQTGEPQRCIMNLSDGEKLVLMVLADMYKHLEIKGEFDPDFISTTISGGHLWGFRWKYTHIPFEPSENPPEVSETVDILDMWSSLEESYGKLSPADNQKVEKEANRTSVRLFGFDANKEDHYFIARYLIEQLDRYPSFRGRDLNSPSPRIDGYRRMYRVFEAIRPTLVDRSLNADEIVKVLNAE
jgi:uncharacterized protein YfbU (UPF0304 family)